MKVVVFDSRCVGTTITEKRYDAVVVKENKKSIRVELTRCEITEKRKVIREYSMKTVQSFKLWKEVEGKKIYKNELYGIIKF